MQRLVLKAKNWHATCGHTCDRSSEATTLTLYWRNSTRCLLKAKRLSANFTGATGFNQRICHNAYTKEPVHILKLHQLQAIWHSTKNNNHPKHNMEIFVTESCRKTQFCSNHVAIKTKQIDLYMKPQAPPETNLLFSNII